MSSYPDILDRLWRDHGARRAANAPGVISLFAGGGFSLLGYSAAGFRPLLAVDWDRRALEVLQMNFPGCATWCGDIQDLTLDKVLEITGFRIGELDLLDGSPPCEGFSLLGDRRRDDPRNLLIFEFSRFVAGLQPKVFVLEEVPAMARGRTKHLYDRLIDQLQSCGYRIEAKVLNAVDFQVPQDRERLVILGVRTDVEAAQ